MVALAQVRASNAQVPETPGIVSTAVFVGATSGIGKSALSELVTSLDTESPVRIYVVGRRETAEAAKAFLDTLREANPAAELVWTEGEVSLLADVKRICDHIKTRETSLDLLFLSAGYTPFSGRVETTEGLETSQVLNHYSRILFARQLLSLLRRANGTARVVSVLAGGIETTGIDLEDLDLSSKPGNFGSIKCQLQMAVMHSLCLEQLAEEDSNAGVVFIHTYPGVVNTRNISKGWGNRHIAKGLVGAVSSPLFSLFGLSPKESGERMLYLMTSAAFGTRGVGLGKGVAQGLTSRGKETGGVFIVNRHCEAVVKRAVMEELRREAKPKMWASTEETLAAYLE